MAKEIRHILVALRRLQHAPKNELYKAGALAKASGASLELFHAIDEPDPGRSYPQTITKDAVAKRRAAIVAKNQGRLERFAQDKSLRGVRVTCAAVWDHPPYEAIVRHALATHADLVIAVTHGHRFGARLLLRNTDWELIRHCPVPLLLMKSRRARQKPVVLAAVDPFDAHAKPADLDARVLERGKPFRAASARHSACLPRIHAADCRRTGRYVRCTAHGHSSRSGRGAPPADHTYH